ncbi:HAD family hydrolase [candidate division KSB1 bacterium]
MKTNENILVLFDIDGTILSPGAGARRSLSQALFEVIGTETKIKAGDCAGKTDPVIISNVLKIDGNVTGDFESILFRTKSRYLELLEQNYNKDGDAFLYTGVMEIIEKLNEMSGVYLALLTGNFEEGARIKLSPFGLNELFPTGAFGSDGFLRTELTPVAVKRSEELFNVKFAPNNIVVIGDTASDIECGKVINARTIGISQHLRNEDTLKAADPDFVFRGFENTDDVLKAILNSN